MTRDAKRVVIRWAVLIVCASAGWILPAVGAPAPGPAAVARP
jgi:hypothetical protein